MDPITGRFQCGTVSFHANSKPKWVAYCHCNSYKKRPEAHIYTKDQLSWQHIADELSRFEGVPGDSDTPKS